MVINSGSNWGTGVVVDSMTGTIITCSHVIKETIGNIVKVLTKDRVSFARLIYKTRDGRAYDLAVLKLEPNQNYNLKALTMASKLPAIGNYIKL